MTIQNVKVNLIIAFGISECKNIKYLEFEFNCLEFLQKGSLTMQATS